MRRKPNKLLRVIRTPVFKQRVVEDKKKSYKRLSKSRILSKES